MISGEGGSPDPPIAVIRYYGGSGDPPSFMIKKYNEKLLANGITCLERFSGRTGGHAFQGGWQREEFILLVRLGFFR